MYTPLHASMCTGANNFGKELDAQCSTGQHSAAQCSTGQLSRALQNELRRFLVSTT